MEKTYKRILFDIELAKKIQSGEVEGRIVTNNGYAVRIICFDKRTSSGYPILGLIDYPNMSEMCKAFNVYGLCYGQPVEYILQIEIPDNELPFKPFDKVLVREDDGQVWHCDFYSYTDSVHGMHYCVGHSGSEILPYEGNEHLVGTTDKPKED